MKSLRRTADATDGCGSSTYSAQEPQWLFIRFINDNLECFSWLPLKQIVKTSLACQNNIQNEKMNLRQEQNIRNALKPPWSLTEIVFLTTSLQKEPMHGSV